MSAIAGAPKTLDQARSRISELEGQLNLRGPAVDQTAELRGRIIELEAELKTTKTQLFLYKTRASALSQTNGTSSPASATAEAKPIELLSETGLIDAMDAAQRRGDQAEVGRLYKEYQRRRRK